MKECFYAPAKLSANWLYLFLLIVGNPDILGGKKWIELVRGGRGALEANQLKWGCRWYRVSL